MLEIDRSAHFKNLLILTVFLVVVLFILYFTPTPKLLNIFSYPSLLFEKFFKKNSCLQNFKFVDCCNA